MAGYNRIIMIGNLTRDPEYKQLPSGQPLCRLGLASNRQYRNRQTGNMVQEVCFVDVDVFGPQAESCRQYLEKGRPVLVEGRLKFDTWESQEGQTRSKHTIVADRVVFLSSAMQNDSLAVGQSDTFGEDQDTHSSSASTKPAVMEKPKVAKKKKEEIDDATDTGELAFTDEPPFQDDLPF